MLVFSCSCSGEKTNLKPWFFDPLDEILKELKGIKKYMKKQSKAAGTAGSSV